MAASEDTSYDAKLARLDERIRQLQDQAKEAKEKAEKVEAAMSSLRTELERAKDRYARLVTKEDQFSPDQVRTLLKILEQYENENEDKNSFNRALKASIVTMIVSVLLFSVLVPVVQHFLVGR